ncbi:hypothetical protein H5410_015633 [Solanum commersonii]|uniref:Uncharacterized protein n=1 Tax=Solanum commersonii TaxID=4109 RepID=A0A9J5ZUA4_SOLCO|nr:hypothetical protein H5410_015633 [Solanum commersonii]
MINLPILLDTIRITVPCYITNNESGQDLILGNLFMNSLEDYKNVNEFLLLCEHLDTRPKRNSSPEGNINPKKVAGDVPLAASAKNISSVSLDMPNPSLRTKEPKFFVRFRLEDNILKKNNNWPLQNSFIISQKKAEKRFTTQLFEFGYLDRVYAKAELKELSGLPNQLVGSIKNYAQGERVYCRFFSISMECKDKQIQTKRAFGIKALYFILKIFYNEDMKVIDHDHDWVLMTKGRSKSKVIKDKILDIELDKLEATEEM